MDNGADQVLAVIIALLFVGTVAFYILGKE